jgi:branched-chain amino acid transport system permease protein
MENVKKLSKKLFRNDLFKSYILLAGLYAVLEILIVTGVIPRYYSTIAILILVMIIMSTSLNIATGFLGQLHLGHAAFMGIGAYAASIFAIAFESFFPNDLMLFLASTFVAMIIAGIFGFLIGTPALRLRGDYLGIMTLGFGEIVRVILNNMGWLTNGAQGLYGIPRVMNFTTAFWTTVIVVTLIFLFMNSRHGRAILSIREDEIASESVGINITRYKLVGFVLASMFAAVGGSIFAFSIGFIAPRSFNFLKSVEIFVIVVLGGMGSLSGAIVASIALVALPEVLRDFASYRYLAYSSLLIIVMLFRPQGLMGTKELSLPKFFDKIFIKNPLKGDVIPEGSDS